MDRKKFLTTASLAAFSLSAFGNIRKVGESFTGDCRTTNDILGPFYRPGSPIKHDLTYPGLPGAVIEIKGRVLGPDCTTPVKNAKVEIWHCNINGEYDNKSDKFNQRASWTTNEKGEYSFKTIMPGKYLNGRLYRPAHIHFRVSAENHNELISQLYFKGDPHIEEDAWASDPKAIQRTASIIPVGVRGDLTINFDIFL